MLFRSPSRNRRVERSPRTALTLRGKPGRRARWRFVGTALGLAMLTLGSVYLGLAGWRWAQRQFLDSGLFALQSIEIQTDGVWVRPDQIRRWAGVREGENLLLVDLPRIRRDLELVPQIESVAVERVLPHLLRIRITEREPVLQVQAVQPDGTNGIAPAVYYLDRAAVVMPSLAPTRPSAAYAQALENLPVLRGISSADLRPGNTVRSRSVQTALRFQELFDQSPLATLVDLRCLDVSSPVTLEITTGQGARITCSYDRLEDQVERWRLVHEAGARIAKAVASLDLSVTNNCPVLWLEASLMPPAKPKPNKPTRPRRKHV